MILDNINNCSMYSCMHKYFETAFDFIKKAVAENYAVGKYEIDGENLYASVQEYNTKLPAPSSIRRRSPSCLAQARQT